MPSPSARRRPQRLCHTGRADEFSECFIGSGDLDVTAAMRALHEVGFSGPIIDDHAPA